MGIKGINGNMKRKRPKRKIRVLLAKPGLDGHSVGIRMVAKALLDNGFEVIFLGIRQKNESIINTAIDESVDVIGLSMLSGAHLLIMEDFMARLRNSGYNPVLVVGGVIPVADRKNLLELGVDAVFSTQDSFEEMANFITTQVTSKV